MDALTGALTSGLTLRADHWEQMQAHAAAHAPQEACGLVAGIQGRSVAVYLVENALHSPVRFRMNPEQQLHALLEIEQNGWDLAAIFHSHPLGPDHPSETDLAEAAYPAAINLIWFQHPSGWSCRAFLIHSRRYTEVPLHRLAP